MNNLSDIKCFCLDMDGTIYLSDVLFDGALTAVQRMQRQGRVLFLTNNSSRTRQEYFLKLTKLGFDINASDIYTSAVAAIDLLRQDFWGKKVFLAASDNVEEEFLQSGIALTKNQRADVAVLTFDKTLTYQKLEILCRHISDGAFFIATHPDLTCPTLDGFIPDVGSFLRLIKAATGKSPDIICGKPTRIFGRRILQLTGFRAGQIAMVGDRLSTDIRFAFNMGFKSVLVLSGETKAADLKKQKRQPDLVVDSIKDILTQ